MKYDEKKRINAHEMKFVHPLFFFFEHNLISVLVILLNSYFEDCSAEQWCVVNYLNQMEEILATLCTSCKR